MPAEIVFSPTAETDLDEIWLAIAWESPKAADRLLDNLRDRVLTLARFPELGPARPDVAEDLRLLTEGNYLILYRVSVETVEIVRIVHGARNLSELF